MRNYAGYKLPVQLSAAGYKLLDPACGRDAPARDMRRAAAAVERAMKAYRDSRQVIEKELVVLVSKETRLTIVPALNDMHG